MTYVRLISLKPLLLVAFLSSIALTSCGRSNLVQTDPPTAIDTTDECVSNYDPSVDYFPEKAKTDHANGFSVEYHRHYKTVTVREPGRMPIAASPIPSFSAVHPFPLASIPIASSPFPSARSSLCPPPTSPLSIVSV